MLGLLTLLDRIVGRYATAAESQDVVVECDSCDWSEETSRSERVWTTMKHADEDHSSFTVSSK